MSCGSEKRGLVWDLGCNDGRFSRIAADGADFVVAVDSDRHVVETLYAAAARRRRTGTILPLVVDLTNPSPAIGWRNAERATLLERGRPDLVLASLSSITSRSRGTSLFARSFGWLRGLESELVIEFPDRGDPMVERLLGAKRADSHPDYRRDVFEALLGSMFRIVDSDELESGTRTLYHATPGMSVGLPRTALGSST